MKKILGVLAISILFFIFFYHLDYSALQSFDEAWYADITRNIVQTGNPFNLFFNHWIFTDHPPLGFVLMAIPTLLLGSNELSARFVPALLGVGSIILIYLSGKKLKSETVGISAAVILLSSMWFMLRARSGNLDIPFVFWSLLTFYSALNVQKHVKYVYLAAFSFAALFLTKTLVGVGIAPVLLYALWLNRTKLNPKILLMATFIWLIIVLPWYVHNQLFDQTFLYRHFIQIGTRSEKNSVTFAAIKKSLFYIQVGMGKWLKVFLFSVILSKIVWFTSPKDRTNVHFIVLFLSGFLLPFLFSAQTEVWHLIPTYAPIALMIAYTLETITMKLFPSKAWIRWVPVVIILCIGTYQFRQFSNLIYLKEYQYSAERDISLKAKGLSEVYQMETFYPALVYYSEAKIHAFYLEDQALQKMVHSLQNQESKIFLVNNDHVSQLDDQAVPYTIIDRNQSYVLISN